jgi:hypothetical protein
MQIQSSEIVLDTFEVVADWYGGLQPFWEAGDFFLLAWGPDERGSELECF